MTQGVERACGQRCCRLSIPAEKPHAPDRRQTGSHIHAFYDKAIHNRMQIIVR